MLTKGAIGNLINRYRAVLAKCNLINTFGSLAVASMLVLGGAGVASAEATPHYDWFNATLNEAVTLDAQKGDKLLSVAKKSTKSININSSTDAPERKGSLTIIGKGTKSEYGISILNKNKSKIGLEKLFIKNTGGNSIYINKEGGQLEINADVVNVSENKGGNLIHVYSGELKITADTLTLDTELKSVTDNGAGTRAIRAVGGAVDINVKNLIINDSLGDSIKASGETGSIDITVDGVAQINSGLYAEEKGEVTLTITGENSYINGSMTADGDASITATLKKGAKWTTGIGHENGVDLTSSSVTKLILEDGTIEMTPDHDVTVGTLEGSGTVKFVNNSESILTVNESGKVTALTVTTDKTADEISATELAALVKDSVKNVDAEKITTTAADGIVNAGFSADADGAITSGGGASPVMKAILENSTVTSISLDKILTNDVRKRLGDIRSDANTTGVWMRWDGGKMKGDGVTNEFNTIQIGGDTKVAKNCRIGFAGAFTHGESEFARGFGELEGFSFALYGTWMGENGMFADVVARLGNFSNEMNIAGQEGDMDNRVASLSAEYGWRFNLAQLFFVEPQVELAYTYVSSDDLELDTAKFSFDSVNSLTGRAGLVAGWNLPDERGNVYARASVLQQFMGDAKITGYTNVGPTVHESDGEDTWLEYGIGANVKLTDNTYVWADVERTEGADIEEEWRGTVGIRYSF